MTPATPSSEQGPSLTAASWTGRSGRAVVPRALRWRQKVAVPLVYGFIEALRLTLEERLRSLTLD